MAGTNTDSSSSGVAEQFPLMRFAAMRDGGSESSDSDDDPRTRRRVGSDGSSIVSTDSSDDCKSPVNRGSPKSAPVSKLEDPVRKPVEPAPATDGLGELVDRSKPFVVEEFYERLRHLTESMREAREARWQARTPGAGVGLDEPEAPSAGPAPFARGAYRTAGGGGPGGPGGPSDPTGPVRPIPPSSYLHPHKPYPDSLAEFKPRDMARLIKDLKYIQRGFPVWRMVEMTKDGIRRQHLELRTFRFTAWPENEIHVDGGFFGTTIEMDGILRFEVNIDMFHMDIVSSDERISIQFLEPYAFNCAWSVMALCAPEFVTFTKGIPTEHLFFSRNELREMTSEDDFRQSVLQRKPKAATKPGVRR
jgi:hypothetical protein